MDVVLAFPVLLLALGLGAACSLQGCLSANSMGRFLAHRRLRDPAHTDHLERHIAGARGRGLQRDHRLRLGSALGAGRGRDRFGGLVLTLVVSSKATLIQPGLAVVIFVITLAGWPYMARIIRGQVLRCARRSSSRPPARWAPPTLASSSATSCRTSWRRSSFTPPCLIPTNILFEAALSFLGVGVQPPTSSWGTMIPDASRSSTRPGGT